MTEELILRHIRRYLKASYTARRVTGALSEAGYWQAYRKSGVRKAGDGPVGKQFHVTSTGDLNPADLPYWAKLSRPRTRGAAGLEGPFYVCGECGQTAWDTMAEAEACAQHDRELSDQGL